MPIQVSSAGHQPSTGRRTVLWDIQNPQGIDTDLDPWLTKFGSPSIAGITLGRIGVAVFLADRSERRNALRQRREIQLVISVPDPDLADQAKRSLQDLLAFVTGDNWDLSFEADTSDRPAVGSPYRCDQVALLSGGLDSYCGALIRGNANRIFFSHSDASVIKYSQNSSSPAIPGYDPKHRVNVRLMAKPPFAGEPSRRSRSILFVALAVALADSAGATSVEVPENGFTSLNPPLAANRGGVLTTRSTHPLTFHLFEKLLHDLGLVIAIENPYEWHTKGELVAAAVSAVGVETVVRGIPLTMSCAKSNLILRGKTFGRNCGLDYACIVRRAGIQAAGVQDPTTYEFQTASIASEVIAARRADIAAVKHAMTREPSGARLAAICGPFPTGYDLEKAEELWKRGNSEIRSLPLP